VCVCVYTKSTCFAGVRRLTSAAMTTILKVQSDKLQKHDSTKGVCVCVCVNIPVQKVHALQGVREYTRSTCFAGVPHGY